MLSPPKPSKLEEQKELIRKLLRRDKPNIEEIFATPPKRKKVIDYRSLYE